MKEVMYMKLEELWDNFQMQYNDFSPEIDDELYTHIRDGFKIMFDIRAYIRYRQGKKECFRPEPKNSKIYINYVEYPMKAFDNEIDLRTALMRKALLKSYEVPELTSTRDH